MRNTGFITVLCVQDLGLDLSDSEDERRDIDIDSEGEDSRLSAGEDSRSLPPPFYSRSLVTILRLASVLYITKQATSQSQKLLSKI
jgi:hypothetical protein